MEPIQQTVQELNLRNTTNAVCVAVAKFTLDQFDYYYPQETPAPARLARQIASLRAAYNVMNEAYAERMKRAETAGIKERDDEGDQIIYGVRGILEGAIRMTYDQARLNFALNLWETYRSYRIDPTENMISQWSKVQQFCEDYFSSQALQEAGVALGLDGAIRRLEVLAQEIRDLMTARNAATPEPRAMERAREALYPEYRGAILLLNAFTLTSDDPAANRAFIKALNDNIDYVRKHSMTGSSGSGSGSSNSGNAGTGTGDEGLGGGDDNQGQGQGSEGGDQGGSSQGGDQGGGGTGTITPGGDNGGGDNGGGGGGDDYGGSDMN